MVNMILSLLALAGSAMAQSSCGKSGATTTITNAADATGLAGCQTWTGSIAVATGASGSINIPNVKTITQDLIVSNTLQLTSLSADSLTGIGRQWVLNNTQILTTLSFPFIQAVAELSWNALPNLQGLTFGTGLNRVMSMTVTNTALQSLSGINLTTASTVFISDNNYLTSIALPLTSVSNNMIISDNGNGLDASFPDLVTAGYIILSNCSTIELPKLKNTTTGGLNLGGNTVSTISLPSFQNSDGIAISNNANLKNFSAPVYTRSSAAVNFINNDAYTGTVSFPQLEFIAGAANFTGAFSDVTIPKLNTIVGLMTLHSKNMPQSVCQRFQAESGRSSAIRGGTTCSLYKGATVTSGSSPSGTGSMGGATSTGAAVANGPIAASTMGLAGALAALFGLLL